MFLRKIRNISIFATIFIMLAFSAALAADNEILAVLQLRAPAGINLSNDVTLTLYPGTGTTGPITPNTRSGDYFAYGIGTAGTYNYRVTGTANYYGVTKLIHITQAQIDGMQLIPMQVHTGRRSPNVAERFEGASVNIFTDQINEKLFGAAGVLKGFPTGGLKTPSFTPGKRLLEYTTQDDLMKFVKDIANGSPKAHLYSLGKTPALNYDMPIVIFTTTPIPANATFEQAAKLVRENGKPTFFHKATIHGEEQSGTEGALAMLLEMSGPYGDKHLERLNYVCIPRMNVAGSATFNRQNQINAFDMNGDHLRVKSWENRVVHGAYLNLMPEVVLDSHEIGYYTVSATTTATAQAFATGGLTDVEATPTTSLNNPTRVVTDFGLDVYANNLHTDLTDIGFRTNHYENGNNGWTCNHGVGRAYYGLMGSVSMLVEVRGSATLLMDRRAFAQMSTTKSMMETLYNTHTQTKSLVAAGRQAAIDKGKVYNPNELVYLYQYASGNNTAYMNSGDLVPGAKYSNYLGMRHQSDMLGNLQRATTGNMILKPHAINDASHYVRSRPTAYIIPKGITPTTINSGDYAINYNYLKEMMDTNKIEYYELKPGVTAPVRQYYYVSGNPQTSFTASATINANALVCDLRPEQNVKFEHGAYVIPLDQVAGAVAVCTFEPDIANQNGGNGTVAQSMSSATEGLALVFRSLTTGNYPYYRLERNNPRLILPSVDCKENVHNIVDHLREHGCNVGFGILVLALIPFVLRRR